MTYLVTWTKNKIGITFRYFSTRKSVGLSIGLFTGDPAISSVCPIKSPLVLSIGLIVRLDLSLDGHRTVTGKLHQFSLMKIDISPTRVRWQSGGVWPDNVEECKDLTDDIKASTGNLPSIPLWKSTQKMYTCFYFQYYNMICDLLYLCLISFS